TVTLNCIVGPIASAVTRQCNNQAGAVLTTASTSANRTGWTLGFGSEFALTPNWSAKGEYDYIDFGSRTGTATDGTTVLSSKTTVQVTKVGLNYKFAATGGRW